jgi:hypothetical protein
MRLFHGFLEDNSRIPMKSLPKLNSSRNLEKTFEEALYRKYFLVSILLQKPNSWAYNFIEVSGHSLKSSQT